MNLDIHRNNAVSSVAMETAFNEGEEWLEQLLVYISDNFDFIKDVVPPINKLQIMFPV